jgi:hypothetical protein
MLTIANQQLRQETKKEKLSRLEKEAAISLSSGITRHASYDAMARHLGLRK